MRQQRCPQPVQERKQRTATCPSCARPPAYTHMACLSKADSEHLRGVGKKSPETMGYSKGTTCLEVSRATVVRDAADEYAWMPQQGSPLELAEAS